MRLSGVLAVLTVGLFLAAPIPVLAQASSIPPEVIGRLDDLGRLAGDAPLCEAMGYKPADGGGSAFSSEIARFADRVGVAPRDAQAAIASAKARETRDMTTARDRVLADLKEPAGDKALRAYADGLAVRCDNAANDPVAMVLMKPPLGAVSTVSRRYVDGLLAPYGRAGWQSSYILATGALAEAVGSCEARLPRSQSRTYLANLRDPVNYPPDILDTILAWLDQRVSAGRDVARKAPPSAAQCHQLVAKRKSALDKAPVG
jgi:hypothetical protein